MTTTTNHKPSSSIGSWTTSNVRTYYVNATGYNSVYTFNFEPAKLRSFSGVVYGKIEVKE